MANEITAINGVALTSITKLSGKTDDNIANLCGAEFTGETFTVASGGSEATDGDYKVHTFTSNGNLNVTAIGSTDIEYLVIAGGGGGIPAYNDENGIPAEGYFGCNDCDTYDPNNFQNDTWPPSNYQWQ